MAKLTKELPPLPPIEEKDVVRYVVGQVATQVENVIVDNHTNQQFDTMSMLAKIANDIDDLRRLLKGD